MHTTTRSAWTVRELVAMLVVLGGLSSLVLMGIREAIERTRTNSLGKNFQLPWAVGALDIRSA